MDDTENPELEEQIFADPASVLLWQVYADWLSEQHDPRGRLLAIKLAGGKAARRIHKEEKSVREALLTRLALPLGFKITTEQGFLKELKVLPSWGILPVSRQEAVVARTQEALIRLFQSNYLRFCEKISLDTVQGMVLHQSIGQLTRPLPMLTHLEIGRNYVFESYPGDINGLTRLMPRLAELYVGMHGVEGCAWSVAGFWPSLKRLSLQMVLPSEEVWRGLMTARMPELHSLYLHFLDDSASIWPSLRQFLAEPGFDRLTHLYLINCANTPELIHTLIRSPLMPRLKVLDLSYNRIGIDGANALIANHHHFAHLKLALTENGITEEQGEILSELDGVLVGFQ